MRRIDSSRRVLGSVARLRTDGRDRVRAYNDTVVLLDGKPFVSAEGGTCGRSQAMRTALSALFAFNSRTNDAGLQTHWGLDGRARFLLKGKPERKVLHTVQVGRNGFLHALAVGTSDENRGCEYLGASVHALDFVLSRQSE